MRFYSDCEMIARVCTVARLPLGFQKKKKKNSFIFYMHALNLAKNPIYL
jgi:hypothetical protein